MNDQLNGRLANETGLSLDFVSRCLDGNMDALAALDEKNDKQFRLLLLGIPLFFGWWFTLYETSLPEFDVKNLSWEWRLAGGEPILDRLKLIVRQMAARPEFLTAEDEIDELVLEKTFLNHLANLLDGRQKALQPFASQQVRLLWRVDRKCGEIH